MTALSCACSLRWSPACPFAAGRRGAFGFDDVGAARAAWPRKPYKAPVDPHAARSSATSTTTQLPRHPLPARQGALARREAAVRADVLPPGPGRRRAGRDQRRSSRPASAPLAFDPALFDYGKNKLDPQKLRDLGFNGFRVHYPINKPAYKDEVLVFQGASYFRAVGKGQIYGLSARGLAVDTARPRRARSSRASSSSGSSGRAPTPPR